MVEEDGGVLVDQLYEFCAKRNMRKRFRVFFFEHRSMFAGLGADDDEQPHELLAAFQRWEELFEEDVAEFLAESGMDHTMFYESCLKFQHEGNDDGASADTLKSNARRDDDAIVFKVRLASARDAEGAPAANFREKLPRF